MTKSLKLSKHSYQLLQNKFEEEQRNGTVTIPYENMAVYMRENMHVMDNLQALIYGMSLRTQLPVSNDEALANINEYVLVKKILCACSITQGADSYIYVEVMRSILRDLKMSTKVKLFITSNNNPSQKMIKVADSTKPHLNKFFYVNLSMLHDCIVNFQDKKLDFQSVKDALQMTLYENIHLFGGVGQKLTSEQMATIKRKTTSSAVNMGKLLHLYSELPIFLSVMFYILKCW